MCRIPLLHPVLTSLSGANVLGEVRGKCAEAGFNSYVTKPVDFGELSNVLVRFMDPAEPGKPIEFMKPEKSEKIHKTSSH